MYCSKYIQEDFKSIYEKYGVDGCFVLYNQSEDTYIRYNAEYCDSGYIPASTFKIPHALIALEEKLITDTSQIIKWNGHKWPHNSWNKDQTLKSSIQNSCVWVYTGFAEHLDIEVYQNYVDAFDYGNKNLTGPPTRFWLAGDFRVTANQQIEFLTKFYNYQLPVSAKYIDLIKKYLEIEKTDTYSFYGKTGGGIMPDNDYIMWLVGYVVKNEKVYFYTLNFKTDNYNKTSSARFEITKAIFKQLKLLE